MAVGILHARLFVPAAWQRINGAAVGKPGGLWVAFFF
jgi:hypothetical protein